MKDLENVVLSPDQIMLPSTGTIFNSLFNLYQTVCFNTNST